VFEGAAALTLDDKGRLSMPARHRETLVAQYEGRITLTRHPDRCLVVYPRPVWEAKRAELAQMPFEAREWVRIIVGSARSLELDSAGRILIPAELRAVAGLERDVVLIGLENRLELWDAAVRAEQEKAALEAGVPDAFKRFIF
jgi:MraZ protein